MEKKVPMRTCIACKECKPKKELIRIVKSGEEISLDGGKSWPYKLVIDERISTSYPDALEDTDGHIYIIYDHGRSVYGEILMAKIRESDIVAGKILNEESYLGKLVNNNISKEQAQIHAASLCLGSDLSMKYSLRIKDEKLLAVGDITMHFRINNSTVVSTEYETKNQEYIFRFSNIAPQQMTDSIQIIAYAGNIPIAVLYNQSIKGYCKRKWLQQHVCKHLLNKDKCIWNLLIFHL